MGKINSVLWGQSSDFILDNMRENVMVEAAKHEKDPIKYLNII